MAHLNDTEERENGLPSFRTNNFNLIRLLAALQVVVVHAFAHLHLPPDHGAGWLLQVLRLFPGVPIFFFVSGFLISRSYETNPRLADYALNRALRIFPALVVCTAVSVLSVHLAGHFDDKDIGIGHFIGWLLAQVSFLQFYNPDFMRGFGTGVLNGSLWTISVELQFYVVTPLLYALLRGTSKAVSNARLVVLAVLFLVANVATTWMLPTYGERLVFKMFGVSLVPWVYLFLVGVLVQRNFAFFARHLAGRGVWVLMFYVVFCVVSDNVVELRFGNRLPPAVALVLCAAVFAIAYTRGELSRAVLGRVDASYGIYIYHAPVLNLFLFFGFTGTLNSVWALVLASVALGLLSWFAIEKPALRLKRNPLARV